MAVNSKTLSLKEIVNVVVEVSPLAAPRRNFNQMMVLGPSSVIPASERIRVYQTADALLDDGFIGTDPEYLVAQMYFGQSPAPQYLYVGMVDDTVVKTAVVNAAGTGYVVGDLFKIVQSSNKTAIGRVTSIGASGSVTAFSIYDDGTGYTTGTGLATENITGAGNDDLTIDISAVGETQLAAMQSCRSANWEWYVGIATDAAKADHEAIAAWAEAAEPSTVYAYTTTDAEVLSGVSDNVMSALKALGYDRTYGQYATTQSAVYPNNVYAVAAIMGYAMGQNTGAAGTAYTLKFKGETGVATEPLTLSQKNLIEGYNGNLYLSYGNYYNINEQGVMASGKFFDEILNLDMLKNDIQLNVMDLLYGTPKVPQTDSGVTQIINAVNAACKKAVDRGFLGPGTWTGSTILNLNYGDPMPQGYVVQAQPIADQSQADRELRKSPPIYVAIKEAGAIHSVLITVWVSR